MQGLDWIEELQAAVTVTDAGGTIVAMNGAAREAFAAEGGARLLGSSVFDCHHEPARTRTLELYRNRQPNHYTISKQGQRKIIHQMPWFHHGEFAGFVEISVVIPDPMPHFDRA